MPRFAKLFTLGALIGAGCSTPAPTPVPTRAPSPAEQGAVALGMSVVSADDAGAPRLIRAVVPRAQAPGFTGVAAARDHLQALAPLYVARDRAADLVEAGTQPLRNGGSVVTFRQQVDQVDVDGGNLRVMLHPDGTLAAVSGTMRRMSGKPAFSADATLALRRALEERYGTAVAAAAIANARVATGAGSAGGYERLTVAPTGALRVRSARVKRVLVPDGAALVPSWSVEILGRFAGKPDAVRYFIADADHRVLRTAELIHHESFRYRTFADADGERRPFDGPLASYMPHPTGFPDNSLPGPVAPNVVTMDSFNIHRDPWLPANATTTLGNNVEAFANRAGDETFEEGDVRPEVKPGRVLNATYDLTRDPLATPNQARAATVNLFYVLNWLHDWYYDSGFTEVAGNAQASNYGRGGLEGDRLLALAQDSAFEGQRDNAFMSTPADGESPSMHMFIYNGSVDVSVTAAGVAHSAAFFLSGAKNFNINGRLALAGDGCAPLAADVRGRIALVEWDGSCDASQALASVEAGGASGAVLWSHVGELDLPGLANNFRALIVGEDTGQTLADLVAANPRQTVTLRRTTNTVDADAALDQGVVAHEWGHYLHLRLAECATWQCSAMSEGWGDFVALHLELRAEDDRAGTFTSGMYAMAARGLERFGYVDPGYFADRRYPYSVDRSKNPLTFGHIAASATLPAGVPLNPAPASFGNNETHAAGEVWAAMLWEAYNALIDRRGFADAQRRMSDYVVAGLLLTPPDATYVEGRDAILAAAAALDTDDMLVMSAAFAGRGAGSCAVAPPRASSTFEGVVEDGTLAGKLEATVAQLVDDGASCDHDGYLDRGERGTLRVRVSNGGVLALGDVTVTATTEAPGVTIGAPVTLSAVAPFEVVDVEIPVTIDVDAPVGSIASIAVVVAGQDDGCGSGSLALQTSAAVGFDDVADSATVDTVETRITPWQATGEGAQALWSRPELEPGNHAWLGADAGFVSDTQLVSPVLQASATAPLVVTLQHAFDFEFDADFLYDGGVVEVSTDGGASWRDAAELGAVTYPGTIPPFFSNPLSDRDAFGGRNGSFPSREPLVLDFGTQLAGEAVQLRFRIGTDECCNNTGWQLDDISVSGIDNTPFPSRETDGNACAPAVAPVEPAVRRQLAPRRVLATASAR